MDLNQLFSQMDNWNSESSSNNGGNGQNMSFEQQFKLTQLQQLQQLQNQIFQQQIALISGQNVAIASNTSPALDPNPAYLPTPGPSTELRPQQQEIGFDVSPILLNYAHQNQQHQSNSNTQPAHNTSADFTMPNFPQPPASPTDRYRGSFSAPAQIAFAQVPAADIDIDVSPLTSPWLGADVVGYGQATSSSSFAMHHGHPHSHSQHSTPPQSHNQRPGKRQTPPSDTESTVLSRKRPSRSGVGAGVPGTNSKKGRGTRSTGSTPLFHSLGKPVDSPSPVDLNEAPQSQGQQQSMPPPPPPQTQVQGQMLKPVTPSSIMNLDMDTAQMVGYEASATTAGNHHDVAAKRNRRKSLGATPSVDVSSRRKTRNGSEKEKEKEKEVFQPIITATSPISFVSSVPSTSNQLSAQSQGNLPKTSHKAAEQKRRDSLKTTFDDLRGLLPPIPLTSDVENNNIDGVSFIKGARPNLPGSLPPRGPPKGGVNSGPNKGISKLQLLICGNEYIRLLKARVDRRDDEIGRLRGLVRALRLRDGDEDEMDDLERDLDAVELTPGFSLPGAPVPVLGMVYEGEGEGDEDG